MVCYIARLTRGIHVVGIPLILALMDPDPRCFCAASALLRSQLGVNLDSIQHSVDKKKKSVN